MNKVRLYWTLQICGWLSFALAEIIAFQSTDPTQIIFWLIEASLFLTFTHVFRNVMIRRGWLAFNMTNLIPRTILSVLIMGFLISVMRWVIGGFLLGLNDEKLFSEVVHTVGLTVAYALIFFLWSVLYITYHYFERYNRSLKHEAAINEIELNNLKSQLNPHFIFNALNSIRALVDEDPRKSKKAITQLSNILRNSLASDKKKLTKFQDELLTVTDYLGLESIRFEERLKTEFDIAEDSYNFLVPPLMLQTLVENGIKHGISKLKEGGFIKLKTMVDNGRLKIQIRNSGHYKNGTSQQQHEGLGLKNTYKRLNLLYQDEAQFNVSNESADTVLTELVIPKSN